MDPKHLDELINSEHFYWWHVAKRCLISDLILRFYPPPARLVEGGVGGGANLLAFQELGYTVTGLDIMPAAIHHCRQLNIQDVHIHSLEECWPIETCSVRVVVLLDVMEHLFNPVIVLKNAASVLDCDGGIVVTVPAIPFLYGPWDKMLGHQCRYTKNLLKTQAEKAGLRIFWWSYWNTISLPVALLIRVTEKLFNRKRTAEFPPVSRWVNSMLIAFTLIERRCMYYKSIPFGLSLVGVLVK